MFPQFKVPSWVTNIWYSQKYSVSGLLTLSKSFSNETNTHIHEQPEASVVVIALNEERHILDCIVSLLKQETNVLYELIVVDNGSTDKTVEILKNLGISPIIEKQRGHGFARQAGMNVAKGKYLINCDSDTIYHPLHVDTMVKALRKDEVVAVFGKYSFLPDGRKSRFTLAVYELFRDVVYNLRLINRPELCVGGASLALNMEFAKKEGWRKDIRRGEDGNMVSRMKKYGKIKHLRSKRVRIWSSSRRHDIDKYFVQTVFKRLIKEWKRRQEFFHKQKGPYKDRLENLI